MNSEKPGTVELDDLLGVLREAPRMEPSDEIRENLRRMISTPSRHARTGFPLRMKLDRFRWAVPTVACAAILIAAGMVAVGRHSLPIHFHFFPWILKNASTNVIDAGHMEAAHGLEQEGRSHASILPKAIVAKPRRTNPQALGKIAPESASFNSTSFNLELPYSNREIANGTGTTIRVAVSREELAALGTPFPDAAGGSKFLAEINLGDDGLPRSIRVPLPLRSLR